MARRVDDLDRGHHVLAPAGWAAYRAPPRRSTASGDRGRAKPVGCTIRDIVVAYGAITFAAFLFLLIAGMPVFDGIASPSPPSPPAASCPSTVARRATTTGRRAASWPSSCCSALPASYGNAWCCRPLAGAPRASGKLLGDRRRLVVGVVYAHHFHGGEHENISLAAASGFAHRRLAGHDHRHRASHRGLRGAPLPLVLVIALVGGAPFRPPAASGSSASVACWSSVEGLAAPRPSAWNPPGCSAPATTTSGDEGDLELSPPPPWSPRLRCAPASRFRYRLSEPAFVAAVASFANIGTIYDAAWPEGGPLAGLSQQPLPTPAADRRRMILGR